MLLEGRLDVVVDPGRSQPSLRAALEDADSRLRWQVVASPADAVVLQGAAHAVVGHGAVLKANAAASAEASGEERAELLGPAVRVLRPAGLSEVSIRPERVHDRIDVAGVQRLLVATDDITGMDVAGLEDGGSDVASSVDGPLAAVGAEHH